MNKKVPNLNHRLVAAVLACFCISPAAAATCAAGYYLSGGSCVACDGRPFYCPGDDTRHPCPTTDTDYNQYGFILEGGTEASWAGSDDGRPKSPSDCRCGLLFRDENGNKFLLEQSFNGQNYWGSRKLWYHAGAGFYLSGYDWSSAYHWYNSVKSCTNAPEHAHYTGPGTPDEPKSGGATDYNNCPWECDDGYGRHNNECVPLCAADMQRLKTSNGLQFNLYPVAYSNPALHVKRGNTICYGVLVQGSATNTININYHGQIYHMAD